MDQVEIIFLRLSYVITIFFFIASVVLFNALLIIKNRVWKYFKRRD